MGQACSICNHERRLEIDRAIVQGQSYNSIARRFGADSNSIAHHSRTHLSRQLVQAYEQKSMAENMDLLAASTRSCSMPRTSSSATTLVAVMSWPSKHWPSSDAPSTCWPGSVCTCTKPAPLSCRPPKPVMMHRKRRTKLS